MSQRVVVLTDREIESLLAPPEDKRYPSLMHKPAAIRKLLAALEHPEGITDEMAERTYTAMGLTAPKTMIQGMPEKMAQQYLEGARATGRHILEAALNPGDGEQ